MKRIRLTSIKRIAKGFLASKRLASNYGNFKGNLLKLYPGLLEDAKRYGLEGGLQGSGFVIHHLDKNSTHYIPSCIGYTELIADLNASNKEIYCKRLNRLLSLKSYINKNGIKVTKELAEEYDNLSEQELREQTALISKLDAEVAGIVLIPKKFHDYLHSSEKAGRISLPKTKNECFMVYKNYLRESAVEKKIKEYEKKIQTVRGQVDTIVEITSLLKPTMYENLKKYLKPASERLIKMLKGTR